MSYILDALKRSEQDRRRHQSPSLRSIHDGELSVDTPSSLPAALLWSALGAALVGGIWFTLNRDLGTATAVEASLSSTAISQREEPQSAAGEPASQQAPVATMGGADERLYQVWEMNPAEQRFLEELDISMHVYSTQPTQRTILINGLRLREGDRVGADLELLEITPQGIVLEFAGRRVALAVATGW